MDNTKWGTPAGAGEVVACGNCGGTGWMVRDPDIGTDQECFVCDGSGGYSESATPQPTQAQAGAVPLNWPTNEMIEAGRKAAISHGPLLGGGQSLWHVFRDMLAAAPSPQKQGGQHD